MTETMWKIIDLMYNRKDTPYWSSWSLREQLGIDLAGCGFHYGDDAIEQLVTLGLIEELPDLGCRYRIVVKEVTK